ncbi:hypothetical protein BV20DRAFT_971261 [Pilatotrama ljubarskyi]|nr:hypothetical protein BV20DRAFT_971261 [Pilatotrama ljubarskyi]
MPPVDPLQRLRAFPRAPAPNDDSATVKSNLADGTVQLLQNILAYHVAHYTDSKVFGNNHAKSLKLVEAYVVPRGEGGQSVQGEKLRQSLPGTDILKGKPDDLEALTVCEATVEEDMLNVYGTLSGACATLLIDIATFSALFALGVVAGTDPSGFSVSMNVAWHAPALRGTTLRFVSSSLSLKPRIASAKCEVYDKKTGRLLVSATQIISPIQRLPVAGAASVPRAVAIPLARAKL